LLQSINFFKEIAALMPNVDSILQELVKYKKEFSHFLQILLNIKRNTEASDSTSIK
jgi:hypothetical protein